jgi:hypothetical protein
MTSSDDWISSFGTLSLVPSPSPSSSQSSPGVTILSGVSSSSGEYGGGVARYFDATAPAVCFGFVGAGCKHFCLKELVVGGVTCGVVKHTHKFKPEVGHYYLQGVDRTAYCEPTFNEAIISVEFKGSVGLSAKSIMEWKELFQAYTEQQGVPASGVKFLDGLKSIALKTPKKSQTNFPESFSDIIIPGELKAIANQVDDLPTQSHWWEDEGLADVLSSSLTVFLQDVRSFLLKYD